MDIAFYQVDAFANQPFQGNPAAVCLLKESREAAWMQAVAAENNLSETAFLLLEDDGYRLRWFTPKSEVRLCGHATLASAHVLFETQALSREQTAVFYTASGVLKASFDRSKGCIELDFPATPVLACDPPAGMIEALGVKPVFIGRGDDDYLVEVRSVAEVEQAEPDFGQLLRAACRGVIVTARSTDPAYDFVSRFFAPAVGINEDPVTGSAHCRLTPYWQTKLGKDEFTAYQASRRGGVLRLRAVGDRVRIGGKAVTVIRGELIG